MASVTTTTGTADHVSMEFESHLKNVSEKATKSKERKLTDRQRRAKRSRQQDSARYSLSSSPPASVISAATTFAEVGLQIESGEVDLESLLALKEDDPRFNAQLALISKLREQLTDDDDCEEEEEGERHEHCAPATACSSSMCLVLASPWSTTSGQYLELEETPATNPFEVLPEEVLFVIFSFLHGQDISNAVEKVCKHWRTLAQDDQLWLSLLRRAYPEEAAEFKKTANRSWKWLYRSRKFIIESPEAIKGAVTGRYESAEYIYEGEWLDGKHHGWGKKIWKNLRYDTEEESDSATETEALKEEEGDSEQEGDANASGDPTNAEAQALDKQAPQPSHPQSAKAKKPKKKVVLSYYEGEWKEGKEHGRGMRLFEEDHYYFGEWKEGEREGTGYYHWPNKTFYEGEFKEGFRHGTGSYTWSEKARYVGGWQRGIEHGVGVRTWADGDRYEGDWVHGTRTGKGRYTWPNGSSYQGQWLQCAHEGHGVYRWPDGRMYKGEFSNNKKHGYGEYNWPDGAMFAGHWRAGVRHGEGSMKWSDGTKFVGVWSFDKRGDGKYYQANGDEVPFATGAAWTKKYDLYFSMPMDVWETMYLPEINKLIQEKKKKEHESRAQEQQMRMQQLRVSGSSIANTTSTSSTSGDEGDDVDNDNDNDDSDVDLSTSSSTAMAEEDESQSDGDRTD